ncbi:uncharacterized protein LOC127834938 isoform X3 [Dreissena polymorpha]|uniref:THD domain-containing protein n=1 Tax=Dreissena polymorpha TaxID=45954 RepID=A0A9D4JJP5_DREPO|nr:uncharacterized protein LOC127834938 isoform X3 [Dreissena polymorpha]KAH3814520.1 hypothetical protein DPMN_143022 [Dreissena polymorpha]
MPDITHTDGNTHICLNNNDVVQCTETISTLTGLLQKEITEVYDRTVKQDALETKTYFEENVQIELKNEYLATIPDMKPAAKLVGSIKSNQQGMVKKNDTLDKMKTVLDWFHDRELDYTTGFMRYGVRYQNGRLIVPLTGTYNIYSFLSLTENNDFANVPVQITNRTEADRKRERAR